MSTQQLDLPLLPAEGRGRLSPHGSSIIRGA